MNPDELVTAVNSALRDVEDTSPSWPPPEFPLEPTPVVEHGCPTRPIIFDQDRVSGVFDSRLVDRESYYAIFVYVVAPHDIESAFPGKTWALTGAEHVCQGDVCNVATQAIYIDPVDLTNRGLLARALRMALGLVDSEIRRYEFSIHQV